MTFNNKTIIEIQLMKTFKQIVNWSNSYPLSTTLKIALERDAQHERKKPNHIQGHVN